MRGVIVDVDQKHVGSQALSDLVRGMAKPDEEEYRSKIENSVLWHLTLALVSCYIRGLSLGP